MVYTLVFPLSGMAVNTDGGVIGGMPHIEGTRISVHHIILAWVRDDRSTEEIAGHLYPHLSEDDVVDALKWVFEHRDEYDRRLDAYRETTTAHLDGVVTPPSDLKD